MGIADVENWLRCLQFFHIVVAENSISQDDWRKKYCVLTALLAVRYSPPHTGKHAQTPAIAKSVYRESLFSRQWQVRTNKTNLLHAKYRL